MTNMQIVHQVALAALNCKRGREREHFIDTVTFGLAAKWDKPKESLYELVHEEIVSIYSALDDLDVVEGVVRTFSKDSRLLDGDGNFVGLKGLTDGEIRDFEKSRGGHIAMAERPSKTYVVLSPYDDTQFGEFSTREEAQSHAEFIQRSCYVACYSTDYGLEWEDWSSAPDVGIASNFDRRPGKAPERGSPIVFPKKKPRNARDETHFSPTYKKWSDLRMRIEACEHQLAEAKARYENARKRYGPDKTKSIKMDQEEEDDFRRAWEEEAEQWASGLS